MWPFKISSRLERPTTEALAPLVPELKRQPKPESLSTRFAPHWFLMLVVPVTVVVVVVAMIGGSAYYFVRLMKADLGKHQTAPESLEGLALESHSYTGQISWRNHSVPISFHYAGTLDNDNDHDVYVIEGPELMIRVVWGLSDSRDRGKFGKAAEVDQAKMPGGWPTPTRFLVDQRSTTNLRGRLAVRAGSTAKTRSADPDIEDSIEIVLYPVPTVH
jgi:hypothetical protein